ncbi:CBS domain-containing protein [Streptomyces sp. NBC_00063]|uniref:CBS domain-containing protein n=1 Tax=Streptomyces sp. NBC_00063 TaxID=2975638 RepID=UPI00225A7A74|nr:CBS domain-containing protein [Streptomyces sp. NBC_00063]MCX5435317.1 CBS domain-containing protein [Streptomyces sp. NBC_00063]
MRHRTVADLMAPTAISVQRGTPFKEIARLLDEFDITAVPVVDDSEHPVGVVSEADLLHKRVAGRGSPTAADIMTSPAITAAPEWSVVRAARVMGRHAVKRLPVVDAAGRLIGVLSRRDLVQLFLRRDQSIREEIVEDVLTRTLQLSPSALSVEVTDGVVTLSGTVGRRMLIPVVVRLCHSVDGVVDVINRLGYERDDMPVGSPTATEQ